MILAYSAGQVNAGLRNENREWKIVFPPIRQLEKYLLYSLKHLIQNLILGIVKYWILGMIKIKKWFIENWPKIKARLKKNKVKIETTYPKSPSFIRRAVFESKIKIKRLKQKIKHDNDLNR